MVLFKRPKLNLQGNKATPFQLLAVGRILKLILDT